MRNIRIQSIIIMLCIMLTISCKAIADNNESLNEHEPISFNSIDSCYTRLYYMPTLEEALSRLNERNEALSRLEMRLNVRNEDAHGITTVSLSLNQYDEGWRVSKVFYSKDSNQLVILYALVYGDDTGIYGLGIPFPYTEYEVFMRNLEISFDSIKRTEAWEREYGPWFLWDLETKNAFYSRYSFVPCTSYTDVFPQWGLPTEEDLSEEEARSIVTQMIKEKYGIDSLDRLPIYEDIRYIITDKGNGGYWVFNYWIQVRQGDESYWAIVFSVRQMNYTYFDFTEAIDPEYLPCILID